MGTILLRPVYEEMHLHRGLLDIEIAVLHHPLDLQDIARITHYPLDVWTSFAR